MFIKMAQLEIRRYNKQKSCDLGENKVVQRPLLDIRNATAPSAVMRS